MGKEQTTNTKGVQKGQTNTKEVRKEMAIKVVDGKVLVDGKDKVFKSKSEMFKFLYDEGNYGVGEIAKSTGNRYQFVYSVIDAHTGGDIRKASNGGPSKSQMFRDDFDKGLKVGEIAKKHNANYTFVHSVIRKYKLQKQVQIAKDVINS